MPPWRRRSYTRTGRWSIHAGSRGDACDQASVTGAPKDGVKGHLLRRQLGVEAGHELDTVQELPELLVEAQTIRDLGAASSVDEPAPPGGVDRLGNRRGPVV